MSLRIEHDGADESARRFPCDLTVSDAALMSLLTLILPVALLLSAVVMFASTFARSFKEAQAI